MKLLIAINKPKDISIILTLCTLSSKVTIKKIFQNPKSPVV